MPRQCTASGNGWQCDRDANYVNPVICPGHYAQLKSGKNPLTELKPYRPARKIERHDPNDMFCRIPEDHQRCNICNQVFPLSNFSESPGTINGLKGRCNICESDVSMDARYGPGAAEWWRWKMLEQGYRCVACGTSKPRGLGWHLDHCHLTGEWRDVLCHICNIELGQIEKWQENDALSRWLLERHGIDLRSKSARDICPARFDKVVKS